MDVGDLRAAADRLEVEIGRAGARDNLFKWHAPTDCSASERPPPLCLRVQAGPYLVRGAAQLVVTRRVTVQARGPLRFRTVNDGAVTHQIPDLAGHCRSHEIAVRQDEHAIGSAA